MAGEPVIPVMRPWLGPEEAAAAADAVASGWVAQGPRVKAFEDAFADRVGAEHAVAVSSCTAGLHLALVALDLEPGAEVVVPSLSFIASANAPRYVGAEPVFADVDPVTQNLTVKSVEAVLTPRTRAVMVVHQAGMPADLTELRALCGRHDLALVEDAACAIGSTHLGAPIGAGSPFVVFSFHPRKILTTGEGGMITTPDAAVADRLRALRQHGMNVSAFDRHRSGHVVLEQYVETGFNYRMTDIQAAIGLVQLTKLDAIIERRRELADRYAELLAGHGFGLPTDPPWGTTNHQSYVVRLHGDVDRNAVLAHLLAHGVSARRGIMAAHREPAFCDHPHGPLPATEQLTDHSLILPLFHEMTTDDLQQVVAAISCA